MIWLALAGWIGAIALAAYVLPLRSRLTIARLEATRRNEVSSSIA